MLVVWELCVRVLHLHSRERVNGSAWRMRRLSDAGAKEHGSHRSDLQPLQSKSLQGPPHILLSRGHKVDAPEMFLLGRGRENPFRHSQDTDHPLYSRVSLWKYKSPSPPSIPCSTQRPQVAKCALPPGQRTKADENAAAVYEAALEEDSDQVQREAELSGEAGNLRPFRSKASLEPIEGLSSSQRSATDLLCSFGYFFNTGLDFLTYKRRTGLRGHSSPSSGLIQVGGGHVDPNASEGNSFCFPSRYWQPPVRPFHSDSPHLDEIPRLGPELPCLSE